MSNAEPQRSVTGRFEVKATGRFTMLLPKLVADVARETTAPAAAARIASTFVSALGARTARVYLSGADSSALELAAADAVDAATLARLHSESGDDDLAAAAAVRLGLLQLLDADAPPSDRIDSGAEVTSSAEGVAFALPLFAGATTIGAVSAEFDELSVKDCLALTTLSGSLGALVDGARLRGEVAHLRALARTREERMALVVHDLRQPLNLLVMAAAHLANRSKGDEQRMLERLRAGGLRLEAMVSDLLDASLLGSGTFALHVTRADLASLVAESVERLASNALVVLEGEIPPLDVDPERVGQIVTNLLVNAQKYGRAGVAPRVSVARRDGVVVVSVTNAGGGISEDERTKVFEAYYRGRGRTPGAQGHGLGLYICKRLVEAHGGRIWTDGDSSQTRFSFSLPVPDADSPRVSETRVVSIDQSAERDA
jgi:signal transduction histidine kinase